MYQILALLWTMTEENNLAWIISHAPSLLPLRNFPSTLRADENDENTGRGGLEPVLSPDSVQDSHSKLSTSIGRFVINISFVPSLVILPFLLSSSSALTPLGYFAVYAVTATGILALPLLVAMLLCLQDITSTWLEKTPLGRKCLVSDWKLEAI